MQQKDVEQSSAILSALGGRRVVGESGYDTIQEAWEAAHDGDIVYVHSSYDAQEAGEEFPIQLKFYEKEVLLTGGHPSGTVINARHTDENIIEIVGPGMHDYRVMPMVQNLRLEGGNKGVVVKGAPYGTIKDVTVWQSSDSAFSIEPHWDNYDKKETLLATFGFTFRSCIAWNCGGDGFRLDSGANPHSTSFMACHSLLNSGYGVMLRGYATRWVGGTIQNNDNYGVDSRSGGNQSVNAAYFEGNGALQDYPVTVYGASSSYSLGVKDCYFQGGLFSVESGDREEEHYGIVAEGPSADIQNCTYRNYKQSFIAARGTDVDVHRSSHFALDDTEFLSDQGADRIRNSGTIIAGDMQGVTGKFIGDMGIHDGTDSIPFSIVLWNGERWISQADGTLFN